MYMNLHVYHYTHDHLLFLDMFALKNLLTRIHSHWWLGLALHVELVHQFDSHQVKCSSALTRLRHVNRVITSLWTRQNHTRRVY